MNTAIPSNKGSYINIAYNVSGAVEAVKQGRFVVIVDIIDMSTTLEAVREAGAVGFWGASPTGKKTLYPTNPYAIGQAVAREAKRIAAKIELIAEPRVGSEVERKKRCADVIAGIKNEGMNVNGIWPNLGAELGNITDWTDKIVIAVTDSGGTVFDAAWQQGGNITTATVARTLKMKGHEPAAKGLKRILKLCAGKPITLVAASSNAMEDVLAVHYLAQGLLYGTNL